METWWSFDRCDKSEGLANLKGASSYGSDPWFNNSFIFFEPEWWTIKDYKDISVEIASFLLVEINCKSAYTLHIEAKL